MQPAQASPLVLPAPPPAPAAPKRPPSVRSTDSGATIRPVSTAFEPAPTVDDLLRETNECRTLVSTISTQFASLEALRNEVVGFGLACSFERLEALANLTHTTGRLVLSLSAPLAAVTARVQMLSDLAATGRAAVLPTEVKRIEEEVETLKLEVRHNMDKVRRAADEELEARESTRRRLEDRVRSENVGIDEEQVARTVDGAMSGLGMRVDLVELNSYAGRIAVENPFTSLSHLIEDAADQHRKRTETGEALSRRGTRMSQATTLVGTALAGEYDKAELGEEGDGQENAPLAGTAAERVEKADAKLSLWSKIRMRWKDYFVRSFLLLAVLGILVGITVFETIEQAKQSKEEDAQSTATGTDSALRWSPTGEGVPPL
ncbi:hypothetical protein JCM10212_002037 [Sporobolomyces blumeae]